MRLLCTRGAVTTVVAALLLAGLVAPASAAKSMGAPWIVAASPTSVTLDWSGGGSFRVYSSRQGGGSRHSVKASTSRHTVTGLSPGTMYCFEVARPSGSGRSKAFCHTTPTRPRSAGAAPLRVVTFNVCGSACGRWPARRAAVVRRILESKADVVTLQEVSRRIPELTQALRVHGFDLMAESNNEAIFGLRAVVRHQVAVGPGCSVDWDQLHEDRSRPWDKSQPYFFGPKTWVWNEARKLWIGTIVWCTRDGERVISDPYGRLELPNGRSAAGVLLLDVRSGRRVTVVTAHLTPGSSARAASERRQQTRAMTRAARSQFGGPVIYTGDVNSSRARGHDGPGRVLAKSGVVDAYDQATSFSRAYVTSSNGFAAKPRRSTRYSDNIDRIFVPRGFGVSDWAVVAPLRRGRNVRPIASDHHPVRATVWLP